MQHHLRNLVGHFVFGHNAYFTKSMNKALVKLRIDVSKRMTFPNVKVKYLT